ncbi:fungal-specific transcription factor domain-containing protein [Fusarium sp. MPI-SDFR-AT-0072]|nr:fungal-specific transcription factor domain-containing protein [Fusarium sp. MPI-SDFR-AT-0072]
MLCDGYPQRTLRWSYKHEVTTNETIQPQRGSLEFPQDGDTSNFASNLDRDGDNTCEEIVEKIAPVADAGPALWPQSEDFDLPDLMGFDSTNTFGQEFDGSLQSITIETPILDFSTSNWLPNFCFDASSQWSCSLDHGLSVQIQPPGRNSGSSMRLLKCWFDEVCPAWSGFDSKSNMNRKMAEDLWQSSPPVFITLQSMSASFLSARLPQMRQSAMSLLKTATLSVQAEIQELKENNVLDAMPTGIMFALICLGTTICWLDTRRVGWPFLQEAKTLLRWSSQQQFAADADKLDFFNKSLVYWDMLISFIYDPEPGTDIHQVSALPSTFQIYDPLAPYSQSSYDAEPHPWTGVSLLSSTLFTRSIRLCRISQRRITELSRGALGSPPETPEIEQAKELEVELLQLQLSPTPSLNDTGDQRTPVIHLSYVAEAYQLASLLQLYIQFPALLEPHFPLGSRDLSEVETTMLWHKRIIPLTLRLIEVLEQIPSESGSCAVQPLLYVCAATGLRHTPALPLDTELSSGSPAKPRPMESILDYLDLLKDPLEHSKEDVDPLSVSQMAIDVSKGRAFILRRLSVFKECLHPGPIGVAEKFAKELWAAYDEAPRWSMDVCWISLMDKKDLRTMFG